MSLRYIRMRIKTEDPLFYGQKTLKIRGRDLVHIPKDIFKLMDLEVLDLSPERESCLDYKLTVLPADIGKLLNLTTLLLDTNELLQEAVLMTHIVHFPINLAGTCRNNTVDTLRATYLEQQPSFRTSKGVNRLKKLTSLHVANNKFERFPLEICDMTSLEFLDFSDNFIKLLPKKVSKLTNLHTFLLFINQLTKLPDTIVSMTELRCLWLGNNHISVLPKGFGYLTKLDWNDRYTSSTLDGNPLISPPLEVCRQGLEAIERFQGVGPNIDAQKQAEEELKQKKRRTVHSTDPGRNINGTESVKDSRLKGKSKLDARKSSSTRVEKSNTNKVQPPAPLERKRK